MTAQPGTGTGTTATDEEGAAALTAQFVDVPAEHDGASKFRFRLVFSDEIFDGTEPVNKNKAVRDALAVTGGAATGSRRVDKTEFDAYWTLTLVLSNPSGAYLADGEATGTIENSDLMPQAWLSRFGRTVAEQVLEAVEERIRSAPQAGVQVTVAGQRIGAAQAPETEALEEAEAQGRLEDFSSWLAGEAEAQESRTGSRAVAPRELLTGSSFALTTGAEGIGGGLVSLWGRGALMRFDGREGDLSLSGVNAG